MTGKTYDAGEFRRDEYRRIARHVLGQETDHE